MNEKKILTAVSKLHENAAKVKDVLVKHGEDLYSIKWNSYYGSFEVTKNGEYLLRYNTRKVTTARLWLKEYLQAN